MVGIRTPGFMGIIDRISGKEKKRKKAQEKARVQAEIYQSDMNTLQNMNPMMYDCCRQAILQFKFNLDKYIANNIGGCVYNRVSVGELMGWADLNYTDMIAFTRADNLVLELRKYCENYGVHFWIRAKAGILYICASRDKAIVQRFASSVREQHSC